MKYRIEFYKDKRGNSPVLEYIEELKNSSGKDSRVKLKKIYQYMGLLAENGLTLREPYIKHIEGDIWELRPMRDRIFFVSWHNNSFVLLHHFVKKTQQTPRKEIEQAQQELLEIKEVLK